MQEDGYRIRTVRQRVVLQGRAEEGVPAIETEDTVDYIDDSVLQTTTTELGYCGGCNAALHEAADIGARCVICGTVLCPTCGSVKCSHCQKSVCPEDREKWGSQPLCRHDFNRRARGMIVALGLGIIGVILVFLVLG